MVQRSLRLLLLCALLLGGSAVILSHIAWANPFAAPPPPSGGLILPSWLQAMIGGMIRLQNAIQGVMRAELRAARDGSSLMPAMLVSVTAFGYGVLHALGPGHGKAVIGSYFLTQRAKLAYGVAMSSAAAMTQAVSAILLVSALALLLHWTSQDIEAQAQWLDLITGAALVGLGLWIGWGVITGRRCCDHAQADHPTAAPPCGGHDHHDHHHHHDHHCDHDHHDHQCGHNHPHHDHASCQHDHPPLRQPDDHTRLAPLLWAGMAVGLRPCSGAILVLLFTLLNGIFWIGMIATLMMGVGVALTVSLISLGAWKAHRWLSERGTATAWPRRFQQALSLLGAGLILAYGVLTVMAVLSGQTANSL